MPALSTRYSAIVPLSLRRRSVAKAAIENILLSISALPSSPEVHAVRAKAVEYMGEADAWTSAQPAAEEKERLMKRVLKLHVEVAKLERKPGA